MLSKFCKSIPFLFYLLATTLQVDAQIISVPTKLLPAALPVREINGLIKDTADNRIPYVAVKLVSILDTIATVTNSDGVFKLKMLGQQRIHLPSRASAIGQWSENTSRMMPFPEL